MFTFDCGWLSIVCFAATSASLHFMLKYPYMKVLLFLQYIVHANSHSSENSEPCDVKVATKKRKVCSEISEIENLVNSVTNGRAMLQNQLVSIVRNNASCIFQWAKGQYITCTRLDNSK